MATTTSIKHLYKAMATRTTPEFWKNIIRLISLAHQIPERRLIEMGLPGVVALMEQRGDNAHATSLMCVNTLNGWKASGCQVFSLDKKAVDLLACTKAPSLSELVGKQESGEIFDLMSEWKLPYTVFAVELPYSTSVTRDDGVVEEFSVVIAMPFADNQSHQADWSLTYLTHEDVATRRISVANGNACINSLITNLCVYINDGGERTRARKRIGFDKVAKKSSTKVNIWNLSMPTTDIPLGVARHFIESGEKVPATFRIGKRFMVRGHYRQQACGHLLAERRRTWIKPHIKGPEEGEAFNRVYKVKGERDAKGKDAKRRDTGDHPAVRE